MGRKIELFEQEILNIDIAQNNEGAIVPNIFVSSGTEHLLNKVYGALNEFSPQLVFLEHSYFCTTLHQNDYRVYVGVKTDENYNLLTKEILKDLSYFFSTLNKNFEKEYPVLFHPDFINKRNNEFLLSWESNHGFSTSDFIHCNRDCEVCLPDRQEHCIINFIDTGGCQFGEFKGELEFLREIQVKRKNNDSNILENLDKMKWCYDDIFLLKEHDFSYKYAIPIAGAPAYINYKGRDIYINIQGSVWIYFITTKKVDDTIHFTIAKEISCLVKDYSINYIFASGLGLIEDVSLQATRAAISQVMARNLSHNIGSHVLSKLITQDSVKGVKKDNRFDAKVYQCNNKTDQDSKSESTNNKLIADFFNYLKSRMDYLADVTTNTPVIENVNSFYGNIISPFIQNRVLNDRISGITNFDYEIILCKPENVDGCFGKETKDCCYKIPNGKDIQVSIPNDVVGVHAFYTILENIIRNTAKHAKKPENGNVEFKIKIEEASEYKQDKKGIDWNAYYAIAVFDNCIVEGEIDLNTFEKEKEKEKQELIGKYEDIINDNKIDKLKKLVFDQNKKLNETILDNNKLRQSHWGLIEMDASAAYLRKIPVDQIDSDDNNIVDFNGESPITEGGKLAIFQAYNEQGKYLGYRFFLRKPQEILIIAKDEQDKKNTLSLAKKDESVLINEGIWIKTIVEIDTDIKENNASPHRLIVITPKASETEKRIKYNSLFSKRITTIVEVQFYGYGDKEKMWNLYYNKNPKSKYNANSDELNKRGTHDNHGKLYCQKLHGYTNNGKSVLGNKFVEISYSATEMFFKDNLRYDHYWPIRIGIIDERVQTFCKEVYPIQKPKYDCLAKPCYHDNGVQYDVLYKYTNIIVPVDECNLNEQNFAMEMDKIIKFIRDCTLITSKESVNGNGLYDSTCEFIVIHIGIIEKLMKSWNEKNNEYYDKDNALKVEVFIKNVILRNIDNIQAVYDTLIITSGRGKPQNLPDDIRYINFSTLYQYLTVQRNKYALTEALFSARKQIKN